MLIRLSLYVVLSILLSILVCTAAGIFCAWLVIVYVDRLCAPCVIAGQHAWVVHMFRRADSKFSFEEIPVYAVQPAMFAVVSFCPVAFPSGCSVAPGRPIRRLQHFLPPHCWRCFGYRISSFRRYSSDKFAYFVRIVLVATVVIRVVVKCIIIYHQRISLRNSPSIFTPMFCQFVRRRSKHNLFNLLNIHV